MTPTNRRGRPRVATGVLVLLALSGAVAPPLGTVVTWGVLALVGRVPTVEILRCLRVQLVCVLGMALCQAAAWGVIVATPSLSDAVHRNIAAWGALVVIGLWAAIPVVSGALLALDRR